MAVLTVYSLDIVIQVGFTLESLDSHLSSHHFQFFSGHSRLSSNNASTGSAWGKGKHQSIEYSFPTQNIHTLQAKFPAVTICGLNKVNCSLLRNVIEECKVDVTQCFDQGQLKLLKGLNEASCTTTGLEQTSSNDSGFDHYTSLYQRNRKKIGYPFASFIRGCDFNSRDCRNAS